MDASVFEKQEFLDELKESVLEMQSIRQKRKNGDKGSSTSISSFMDKMRELSSKRGEWVKYEVIPTPRFEKQVKDLIKKKSPR